MVPLDSGSHAAGVYRFNWDGAGRPEGAWTFRVTADDDLGRHSIADRQFAFNNTLGFLMARATGRTVVGGFKLTRSARIGVRIETPGGALVQTLPSRSLPSGDASVSWKGRAGSYLLSVTATNDVGSVELTARFKLGR